VKRRAKRHKTSKELSADVGRALRRAAKVARKTARMHGTPIYIEENDKIICAEAVASSWAVREPPLRKIRARHAVPLHQFKTQHSKFNTVFKPSSTWSSRGVS
jgi:hypothetical protein